MVAVALDAIKTTFPDAIEIAHPSFIGQRGLYLFFNGIAPREQIGGTASVILLVAENSLTKQTNGAAEKVDGVIKKITELTLTEGDAFEFGGVKPAVFEGSTLFCYAVEIKIEV